MTEEKQSYYCCKSQERLAAKPGTSSFQRNFPNEHNLSTNCPGNTEEMLRPSLQRGTLLQEHLTRGPRLKCRRCLGIPCWFWDAGQG